jgi:hypothetical protein
MNALRIMSTENETPLDRAEQLLDDARFKRVMRMTPSLFAKLSQSERRNFVRWAKHFRDVFTEKARLFERNTKPEPELPADLRAKA